MRYLALVALLVPGLALAAPATKLSMRQVDSTNLHIVSHGGAINWSEDITVSVELRNNGTVAVSVVGARKEHNLYVSRGGGSYNTDDVTAWSTTWTGSFKQTADTLALSLALDADTCTRTKTSDGVAPETRACKAAAKRATVTCTTEQIALDDPAGTAKPRKVAAWQCAAKDATDLGESPDWVLGKTGCIEVSAGHKGARSFRACKP